MPITVVPWDGKPISKSGFYSNVPLSQYHSGRLCVRPSISSSGLRRIFMQSLAHFYDLWPLNPEYNREAAKKTSPALVLGRATHHLLLGQPHFRKEFVVTPDETTDSKGKSQPWSLRFDGAKKWISDREAEGLTVLTPEQLEAIKGMAFRLGREHLVTRAGALNGLVEITMAWFDERMGIWFLSRPDVIPTDSGDFTDLKTLGRGIVSYRDIVYAIGEHGYHMQAALVGEGWRVLTGQTMKSFSLYFVESSRPYCAHMVQLKDATISIGARQNRAAAERFVEAIATGRWPGPGGDQEMVEYVDLSDERRGAIERELARREATP